MSSKQSPELKKVVIVGAGVSAHLVINELVKSKGVSLTMIQAVPFKEAPWGAPLGLTTASDGPNFIDITPTPGVETVHGSASSVTDSSLTVTTSGGKAETISFDYLVAATGFSMDIVLPKPGQTYAERCAEFAHVETAVRSGGNVVVAGSGVVGVEIAANFAESIKEGKGKGKVSLVASGPTLLPGYPARIQNKAKDVLESLGVSVIFNSKVISLSAGKVVGAPGEAFEVALDSGAKIGGVTAYIPAFASGVNTQWLELLPGALDAKSKKVQVDNFLRCKANPRILAVGGCSSWTDSFLGVPKMEAQAATVASNIQAMMASKPLKAHVEAQADMKNAPVVNVGRKTFSALVTEVMPPPAACCLRCCGLPFNLLCPCFVCAACCGPCNNCCAVITCCGAPGGGYPQGKPTADMMYGMMMSNMFAKSVLKWENIGKQVNAAGSGAPSDAQIMRE